MKTTRLKTKINALVGASILAMASAAQAVVITFTGGTVSGGSTVYEENGFRVTSVGGPSSFGDYYSAGNNVIHSHWDAPPGGGLGNVTAIEITKIGDGTFDLNYFILTSNTRTGGGAASGTEQTWIRALDSFNAQIGAALLLPAEDWGLGTTTQVFLGSNFDAVTTAQFYVTSDVDCFGMDEFYIDEAAPPSVPDGGTTASLFGLAMFGMAAVRRKLRQA